MFRVVELVDVDVDVVWGEMEIVGYQVGWRMQKAWWLDASWDQQSTMIGLQASAAEVGCPEELFLPHRPAARS